MPDHYTTIQIPFVSKARISTPQHMQQHLQGRQSGLKSGGAQWGGAENFGVYENHFTPSSTINDRT